MKKLKSLRDEYHRQIGEQIVRFSSTGSDGCPNFADSHSRSSVGIANHLSHELGFKRVKEKLDGQTLGNLFEIVTCAFVEKAFSAVEHLRPGTWEYRVAQTGISNFVQYQHLSMLASLVTANPALKAALGQDYFITPDIVVARQAVTDSEINKEHNLLGPDEQIAKLTQFRMSNQSQSPPALFLHASISCKWTIRSDRSQNTRTEALNLIRNRKGPLPHIVAVTAEPLPMRIASLALGTGDLDCVYHFALPELRKACAEVVHANDQLEMLETMIEGKRLRDISDLPFDLAV
jgi:hypothetical protein